MYGHELGSDDLKRCQEAMERWLGLRTARDDRRAIELQLSNLALREEQLIDALLEHLIDKDTFTARKTRITDERADLKKTLAETTSIDADRYNAEKFLELMKNVSLLHQMADNGKRRRLTESLFSNRSLTGKSLCLTPQKWLSDKEWALGVLCGPPDRDRTRTKNEIIALMNEFSDDTIDARAA